MAQVPKDLRDDACSGQASGAYIMRTNSSTLYYPGKLRTPTVEVVRGSLVTEVHQTFSEWASHIIRLYEGQVIAAGCPLLTFRLPTSARLASALFCSPDCSHTSRSSGRRAPSRWTRHGSRPLPSTSRRRCLICGARR